MRPNTLFLSGLLQIFIGVGLILIWPTIQNYFTFLREGSLVFNVWKNIPGGIATKLYLFNWTNPHDIYNKSVKPNFVEVGPFSYNQTEEKCNITWNRNGTVTFEQLRHFYYKGRGIGEPSLDDMITTVDVLPLLLVNIAIRKRYWTRRAVTLFLAIYFSHLHTTKTARQFLFDGYPEPLIQLANKIPGLLEIPLPNWYYLGWFYDRNGSYKYDGIYNVGTGYNSTFGKLYSLNYANTTPYYYDGCGKLEGSPNEIFEPNIEPDDIISFHAPDFRRMIRLEYVGKKMVDHVVGNVYAMGNKMLDNGSIYPENVCNCGGECMPSGVINGTLSRYGLPLYGSLPHFYKADPLYTSTIDGMNSDPEKHDFTLTVEPTTGILLEIYARAQVSALIRPFKDMPFYENIPSKILIPLMWFDQSYKLPSDELFMLNLLFIARSIAVSVGIAMIIVGVVVMCHAIAREWNRRRLLTKTKRLNGQKYLEVAN